MLNTLAGPMPLFLQCKFLVLLQNYLPTYRQMSGQPGKRPLQGLPAELTGFLRAVQEQSSHRAENRADWGGRT